MDTRAGWHPFARRSRRSRRRRGAGTCGKTRTLALSLRGALAFGSRICGRGGALQEFDDGDDDPGNGASLYPQHAVETRFEVGEVGLHGQIGLTIARGGGVGFGLLVCDTRGLETLRIGERIEARFLVDGRDAATMGRGARGDKRRGGRSHSRFAARWPALFSRCVGSLFESATALWAELPEEKRGFKEEAAMLAMRELDADPAGFLESWALFRPRAAVVTEVCVAAGAPAGADGRSKETRQHGRGGNPLRGETLHHACDRAFAEGRRGGRGAPPDDRPMNRARHRRRVALAL